MEKNEEFWQTWAKIVAKAWADPEFKKRLLDNPNKVFKEQGIKLPEGGANITINENTKSDFYLTLPEAPSETLSEEKLQKIAAGEFTNYSLSHGP